MHFLKIILTKVYHDNGGTTMVETVMVPKAEWKRMNERQKKIA